MDKALNAFRDDLADIRLKDVVSAGRFVAGEPARVMAGLVDVHAVPTRISGRETQFRHGDALTVFELRDGWAWAQRTSDGYVGYCDAGGLSFAPAPQGEMLISANPVTFVYPVPDMKAQAIDIIARGCPVRVTGPRIETRKTPYFPIEGDRFVPALALAQTLDVPDFVDEALIYQGVPYLWGGASTRGIDCSALIQNALAAVGRIVPRDTYMQRDFFRPLGLLSEIAPARGTLMYYRRHVVLFTAPDRVVHADGERMVVRHQSLDSLLVDHALDPADATLYAPEPV